MICHICHNQAGRCICRSRSANDNHPGVIRLPHDAVLRAPSAVQRLAIAYGAMGISRRKIVDFVADAAFAEDWIVVDAHGRRVAIDPEFADRIFRTEEDPSMRWLSDWLAFRHRPPCKSAQERTLPRYRLLWLALVIRQPATAMAVIR